MNRRLSLLLIAICVLAFGLRFLANAKFEGLHEGPSYKGFGSDAVEFNAIGVNLVARHEYAVEAGCPTSFRAPGFPLLLAAIYSIAGENNFIIARIVFCITGALLCLPVFFCGRALQNEKVGLIAATLVTVYPNVLYYTIHFSSEPLFTLLLTLSTYLWLCAWKRDSLICFALSGFLLGLAALTRPVAFYFSPFIVAGILWIGRRQFSRSFYTAAIFILGLGIPIVPWAIRNYQVHDRWLPFVSNGGSTFWGANNEIVLNNPQFRGQWVSTERMGEQKDDVKQLPNEVDRDRLEWAHGKQFIRGHIRDLPRLTWYKLVELWTPICRTPNKKFNLIIGLSYGVTLPFMIWGFWMFVSAKQRPFAEIIIMVVPIVSTVLSSLVFYGSARFRSTIEPLLLLLAAIAVTHLLSKLFPLAFPRAPQS